MNDMSPIALPGKSFDFDTFTYNGHTLRTVVRDGKPWLVVADILEALGLNRWKASHHRYHMDADEWSNIKFSDFECLPELRAPQHAQTRPARSSARPVRSAPVHQRQRRVGVRRGQAARLGRRQSLDHRCRYRRLAAGASRQ